jgi:hypothetical protein
MVAEKRNSGGAMLSFGQISKLQLTTERQIHVENPTSAILVGRKSQLESRIRHYNMVMKGK